MLSEEMFIEMYEYKRMSFSPKDRSILLFEVTFDRHGVQVDADSLKLMVLV